MSDSVWCDGCGREEDRRMRAIAPEGWTFLRLRSGETGKEESYVYACSPACRAALDARWEPGPGRLEPTLGELALRAEYRRPLDELLRALDEFRAAIQDAAKDGRQP